MDAAVLQPARALRRTLSPSGQHRRIQPSPRPIADSLAVLDALDQVLRLGVWVTSTSCSGRSTSSKTRVSGSANDVAVYSIRGSSRVPPHPHASARRRGRPRRTQRRPAATAATRRPTRSAAATSSPAIPVKTQRHAAVVNGEPSSAPLGRHRAPPAVSARPERPGPAPVSRAHGRPRAASPHRMLAGDSSAAAAAGDRGRARKPTPNALTNVATPRPAVSATTATANGIATRPRRSLRRRADHGSVPAAAATPRRTRCPAAARPPQSAPTANKAVVAGIRDTSPPRPVQIAYAGRAQHRPGAEEQQRLEAGVVERVQQRSRNQQAGQSPVADGREHPTRADADQDQPDVLGRRVAEQPLQIHRDTGLQYAVQRGQRRRAPAPAATTSEGHRRADRNPTRRIAVQAERSPSPPTSTPTRDWAPPDAHAATTRAAARCRPSTRIPTRTSRKITDRVAG